MAESSAYFSFPQKNIPDKQKNEKWHRDYVLAIMSETMSSGWASLSSYNINNNFNVYQSQDVSEELDFVQQAEDGKELPAIWIDYNSIRSKIKVMIGELIRKGFKIEVEAINEDAMTKKMEIKHQMLARMTVSRLNNDVMQQQGLPIDEAMDFEASGFIPGTMEELETFMRSKYKSNTELVMETALRYNIEVYKWKYKRMAAFRDVMIGGRCHAIHRIRNGYPQIDLLDPRRVVFDPNASDDFLTDAAYFGHIRYVTYEDAIEEYGLTKKEIDDLETKAMEGTNFFGWPGANVGAGFETFNPFISESGQPNGSRILVFEAWWLDKKKIKSKTTVDKYGGEHTHLIEEDSKGANGKNVKDSYSIIVRTATLIGGWLTKDWGEDKNMPRSVDNPSITKLPVTSLLPDYLNFRTVSKVDEISGLQKLKNIILYKIQLEINTAGKKAMFYDIALMPEDFEMEDIMYYLKSSGIAPFDSRKEGIPIQGAPVVNVDGSLGNNIGQFLEMAMYVERQMEVITGINEARQGAASANALVGVTEANLFQSNMATEQYYDQFRDWESRIFQHHADLIKITWAHKREQFAPILGDIGIDFIALDEDVDLDDYAVFVKSQPMLLEDKSMLHNMVNVALQSQQITLSDALILLTEDDAKVGIRKFLAIQERKDAQAAQAQQQEFMMQEAAAAEAREGRMAEIDNKEGHITRRELTSQSMKDNRELERAKIKSGSDKERLEADILKTVIKEQNE